MKTYSLIGGGKMATSLKIKNTSSLQSSNPLQSAPVDRHRNSNTKDISTLIYCSSTCMRERARGKKETTHQRKKDWINYRIFCSHYSQLVLCQLAWRDLHGEYNGSDLFPAYEMLGTVLSASQVLTYWSSYNPMN